MNTLSRIVSILLVTSLLCAVAFRRDGTIIGQDSLNLFSAESSLANSPSEETMQELGLTTKDLTKLDDNTWISRDVIIVSTAEYGKKIYGYGGNTPLYLAIENGVITGITYVKNTETPSYWKRALRAGILKQWIGVAIDDVNGFKADALSGATMSSDAINYNVKYTANAIAGKEFKKPAIVNFKSIAALLILAFCILASYKLKGKKWRTVQLIFNIAVLGFWCGSFISVSLIVNWLSNGTNILIAIVPMTMVALAIIMPFFGKKDFYCTHVCPFGASQELVSRIPTPKIKMGSKVTKILMHVREGIAATLIALMIIGITASYEIINYEAFSVFIFDSASWIVIALASIFLILSLFVHRPYCRFVCPTGQILSWTQTTFNHHKKK